MSHLHYLSFDLKGDEDVPVTVEVTSADGSKTYFKEICDYKASDGLKRYELRFEGPAEGDDTDAVFKITIPEGSKICLDNIKMNKLLQ